MYDHWEWWTFAALAGFVILWAVCRQLCLWQEETKLRRMIHYGRPYPAGTGPVRPNIRRA